MTINEAIQLTRMILNKDQNGYMAGDQFNLLAPIAQLSVLNNRIGNIKTYQPSHPVPPQGFNVSQKSRDEIKQLITAPTTRTVTAGVSTYPTDYIYYDSITVAGKLAKEATNDEIAELNNSLIMAPSTRFPKFVMNSDGFYIFPASITSIKLAYVREPVTPIWAYTITNNEEVYDAGNSQDFELSPITHLEIVMLILQMAGVSINMLQVTQFAQTMEAQGK